MNDRLKLLLENVPFLNYLPLEMKTGLLDKFTEVRYKFGDVIVREGDVADSFFVILDGKARVLTTTATGTEIPLSTLSSGDYFGEMGLLSKGVRTKTVRAIDEVTALMMDQTGFQGILEQHDDIRVYIELQARHRNLENFLRQFSAFGTVPTPALLAIIEHLRPVTFQAGDRIIVEDADAGPMYIIENGYCRVYQGQGAKTKNLAYLRQGEFFGELSLLQRSKRSATVQAVSDCQLLELNEETLKSLLGKYPTLHALVQSRIEQYKANIGPERVPLDFARLMEQPDLHRIHDGEESGNFERSLPDGSSRWRLRGLLRFFRLKRKPIFQFPFVRQIDEADCGAAALAMICRHWGCNISLSYLRELTNTSIDGTALRDLCRAALELGLNAKAVKLSTQKLSELTTPAIIHWQDNHWVVLVDKKNGQVQIADPAKRIYWTERDQFEENWSGYAILIEEGGDIRDVPETKRFFEWILPLMRPLKSVFASALLLTIGISCLQLSFPILTQVIVDDVIIAADTSDLNFMVTTLGVVLSMTLLITMFQRRTLSRAASQLDVVILNYIINKMLSLPMSYFNKRSPEDIKRRLEGASDIRYFVVHTAIGGLIALIQFIAFLSLMTYYSLRMTLVFLVLVPIYGGLMFFSAKILKPAFDELHGNEARYRTLQNDIVRGIQTVKAAGIENAYRELILRDFNRLTQSMTKSNFNISCFDGTIQTLGFLATILFLWLGAQLVMAREMTMGEFIAFQMLIAMSYFPVLTIMNMWEQLQLSSVLLNRLNDIIDHPAEQEYERQIETVETLQGKIEFRNVSFEYGGSDSKKVLDRINFTAHSGQMIAIVGKSNSGKSALVKLIAGLIEPTDGEILYDDVDASRLNLRTLRRFIGLVPQDDHIFTGTIIENIALGDAEPIFDRTALAANLAEAHQVIMQLPQRYYTRVSDSDSFLTRGHKQSIAIARAIYRDPSIFILDEATSSMDVDTERQILANLEKVRRGRTIFIVTHRVETIRHADQILVMDNGKIIERGFDQELMERQGVYYQMYHR